MFIVNIWNGRKEKFYYVKAKTPTEAKFRGISNYVADNNINDAYNVRVFKY